MTKTALITGITGQDGSYLARFLLSKGYEVHGLVRWDAVDGCGRISDILDQVTLHYGDLVDAHSVLTVVQKVKPDEVYNLAALSHVGVSFEVPSSVLDIVAKGALHVFEAVRLVNPSIKIYQASSSEMFGESPAPQNEGTAMVPCSPYGAAKLAAYHLGRVYRQAHGIFIANGILFNHESPMRGGDFVTQKIARAVGSNDILKLGNLEARRDWGNAADYVRGMWMMVQHDVADDFVLATGVDYSVRDFAEAAFKCAGVEIEWRGAELDEVGVDGSTGKTVIEIDEAFYRPLEVEHLRGDAAKARDVLGWVPEIGFEELVRDMVEFTAV